MSKPVPSKNNNQFGIDCDYPGLCGRCHTEIANFDGSHEVAPGVFRPRIVSLKGNYREVEVLLDSGSRMRVSVCEDCFLNLEPEDMGKLMESVINGWQKEVDECNTKWTPEKKEEHMTEYSKFFVVDRSDKPLTFGEKTRLSKPDSRNLKVKVKNGLDK